MKIAFIHHEKKIKTGAHNINNLISNKLREHGVEVKNFFPKTMLFNPPQNLKGLNNILFFYSLLEHRNEVLSCDLIQGTTYTPIAFLSFFSKPVISHFGSTSQGFISSVPLSKNIEKKLRNIWRELRRVKIIEGLNVKTRKPMRDIAEIEKFVAERATAVIATSETVKKELREANVDEKKIYVVHNAIEDFWLQTSSRKITFSPKLVYLGRLGSEVFTMKLKGLDRLIYVYRAFKDIPKLSIILTDNKKIANYLISFINSHKVYTNLLKPEIKEKLEKCRGDILIIPSRYEGFCLSLIEGMSQGLIPVVFPVGVAPEIIRNGENGYVVESTGEMIEKIKRIIEDNKHRLVMSNQAVKTARKFNCENMIKKLLKIYKDVIIQFPQSQEIIDLHNKKPVSRNERVFLKM